MTTPRPVGPYTPAVPAGAFVICSGQLGLRDGALVEGGVGPQLRQAIDNARVVLATEDAFLHDVVKTTVYLTSMDDYAAMNEAYVAAFGDHRPARSAVAVAGLPLGALVEVECWAFLGG